MRFAVFLLSILMLPAMVYTLLRGYSSFHHDYSWKEMDWNSDGTTTFSEFLEASDIGRRDITVAGKACVEFFAYKDGLPVRIDCP